MATAMERMAAQENAAMKRSYTQEKKVTRHTRATAEEYLKRGERIAAMREDGMTHAEIALDMDMTESAVSMSESRRKRALEGSGVVAVNGRIPEAEHAEFQAMTERAKPLIKALRGGS